MRTTSTNYNKAFWNAVRGKQITRAELNEGSDNSSDYVLPSDFMKSI